MRGLQEKADKGMFKSLKHASFSIAKVMRESLVQAKGPSPAGKPPHTHKGRHLRRAIWTDVQPSMAVIGPRYSVVGDAGAAHEFGETFRGAQYPLRPFAGPALEVAAPRLGGHFSGTVGA